MYLICHYYIYTDLNRVSIYMAYIYAKQKHLGYKKLQDQSEAAIRWLYISMWPKCDIWLRARTTQSTR